MFTIWLGYVRIESDRTLFSKLHSHNYYNNGNPYMFKNWKMMLYGILDACRRFASGHWWWVVPVRNGLCKRFSQGTVPANPKKTWPSVLVPKIITTGIYFHKKMQPRVTSQPSYVSLFMTHQLHVSMCNLRSPIMCVGNSRCSSQMLTRIPVIY